ncbi:MAG: PEP-CTERM sorting domain-containing protein [Verrucomicrobiales bacterium]
MTNAVPEPSSILMGLISTGFFFIRRRLVLSNIHTVQAMPSETSPVAFFIVRFHEKCPPPET